jgi:hypothetical protein
LSYTGASKAELIAPHRLTLVYTGMSNVVSRAVRVIVEWLAQKGWSSAMQSMPAPEADEERIRLYAQLLNAVERAILAVDLTGCIIFWNRFADRGVPGDGPIVTVSIHLESNE